MRKVHYQCQRCTNCCKWPGFRLRPNRDGLALTDKPNGECIFLEGRDCRVQPVKPGQCRGFPNTWNFPGWREVCEAVEVESS